MGLVDDLPLLEVLPELRRLNELLLLLLLLLLWLLWLLVIGGADVLLEVLVSRADDNDDKDKLDDDDDSLSEMLSRGILNQGWSST